MHSFSASSDCGVVTEIVRVVAYAQNANDMNYFYFIIDENEE